MMGLKTSSGSNSCIYSSSQRTTSVRCFRCRNMADEPTTAWTPYDQYVLLALTCLPHLGVFAKRYRRFIMYGSPAPIL